MPSSAKPALLLLIPFFCFLLITADLAPAAEQNQCTLCHTDPDRIDQLTEEAISFGEDAPEVSSLQRGNGYGVKDAPFDLFEKVLVDEEFLSSVHGKIPCHLCHRGNPDSSDPEVAHEGLLADPSLNSANTCGECHEDISNGALNSLHMNPAPLYAVVGERCSKEQLENLDGVIEDQCIICHQGSCGSCHVSRPDVSGGGLRAGHSFIKKPDFVSQCLPCHTHPTATDFIGKIGRGDIHYSKHKMDCSACHNGREMHASAEGVADRYHLEERPQCIGCHEEISNSPIPEHVLHKSVSCSVCHATPYQNCSSCHIGTDEEGLSYSQSSAPAKGFKIGFNPDRKGPRYVLMREVGIHRDTFKEAGGMDKFSALPTYKKASPHTIQRRTWQTADCNHCHGNKELFLTQDSVPFSSIVANRHILLKDDEVPGKVQAKRTYILSPSHPDPDMRVSAEWLKKHSRDKNLIILDTRTRAQYEQGHIPGAYHLCFCLFRTEADASPPYMMQPAEKLAEIFGGTRLGLTPAKRVVLYDDGHSGRGVAFLALKILGHGKVSFLDGNLASWQTSGYKLAKGKAPVARARKYQVQPSDLLVSNRDIIDIMGAGDGILIDARNVAQHNGDMVREDIAKTGGALPASLSFPLKSLLDSEGKFYSEERLSWLLSTTGMNPSSNKKIISTCNTNMLAAELFMVLNYLGYNNVRVHDGSWAEWAAEFE